MKKPDRSAKRISGIIAAVACAVIILYGCIALYGVPSRDPARLAAYVEAHESALIGLAGRYPGQYKNLNGYLGIRSMDTRGDDVCFTFPWSFDLPEGGSFVWFAPDGAIDEQGHTFTGSAYIDGLGIDGKGWIKCILLRQRWFYTEYNIPT